ncbi:hypothetical protein ACIQ9P_03575 [Kitasatospora sp. NPDC094019]|uniref:hypothetical protein n=1 Tax=Kitasatospora sp. NPDC094019 TaxID=3364091 RepID=UPI0038015E97
MITTRTQHRGTVRITRHPCVTHYKLNGHFDTTTCADCSTSTRSVFRPWERTDRLCPPCTGRYLHHTSNPPTPTQPGRLLQRGEQLQNPTGIWTITAARRIELPIHGPGSQYAAYVLTHHDGHRQIWRGSLLTAADFHLIPPPEQLTIT